MSKARLRIVFMGTPAFALPSLECLARSAHTLSAVVTGPDQPAGRGLKVQVPPVKQRAGELGYPVLQPVSLKSEEFSRQLAALQPDLIVVVAFRILPANLLTIPTYGAINLHASLLPCYRGAAPINWAIINGDTETGVTIFRLQPTVDTGHILAQRVVPITEEDTAGTLAARLASVGAELLGETVEQIAARRIQEQPQDEELATPAPKIFPELGEIDWYKSAFTIKCLIHGLSPEPGAFTFFRGKRLKILRARWEPAEQQAEPGTLVRREKQGMAIQTGAGWLWPLELQLEGRKTMPVATFLQGFAGRVGDRLGT